MNRIFCNWGTSSDLDYGRGLISKIHIGVLDCHIVSNSGDSIVYAAEGIAINTVNIRSGKCGPCLFQFMES